ncbi:hypothetical protein DMH04_04465 [Kibdelosporangium aridum]|uniref:NUDIX domain-containing protein n=1 Tax=Kibdelosporangium aridum TaxID=2030 RepID=A0A428ZRM9_KIBAR|nr:hypothetical protein [Kibdelosporangium aridum]RSM90715.1 hypothetical protein DMH04_04465 [Kibdelosporangium aridum]
MDDKLISTVALIHVKDRKALLVRPHRKHAFYLPGGKRDQGENDEYAAMPTIAPAALKILLDLQGRALIA